MTHVNREAFFADKRFPFFITLYTIKKGENIPAHTHDFVELVYILEGDALHEVEGHPYRLSSGDVFVIEPGVSHSYFGSGRSETTLYNVLFDREILQHELHHLTTIPAFVEFFYLTPFLRKSSKFMPHFNVDGSHKWILESHLEEMLRESRRKEPGYQLILKTRLIECMVHLSRSYQQQIQDQQAPTPEDVHWVSSVTSLLEQFYNRTLTLDQVSRMYGMSVSTFSTKFKAYLGKTLIEYKHDLHINQACRLLKETDSRIVDIALQVGMEDLSFFYKVFRKKVGTTPSQFRREQMNQLESFK